jgi:hypothetical protein
MCLNYYSDLRPKIPFLSVRQLRVDDYGTLPGWRDFERIFEAFYDGRSTESKHPFDIIALSGESRVGISVKSKAATQNACYLIPKNLDELDESLNGHLVISYLKLKDDRHPLYQIFSLPLFLPKNQMNGD